MFSFSIFSIVLFVVKKKKGYDLCNADSGKQMYLDFFKSSSVYTSDHSFPKHINKKKKKPSLGNLKNWKFFRRGQQYRNINYRACQIPFFLENA